MKTNGKFLWMVTIQSDNGEDQLWITTPKEDIGIALSNARVFLRDKRGSKRYSNARIVAIKAEGTLDA
jgi:hypothetical protein